MTLIAGIHLSGPNANKTALAVLVGDARTGPLKISKVYEKIGAFGTLFSDERLVGILGLAGPFRDVFIDCPLTVPPCVACQRPSCPGAVKCDDVSVAYMLAIASRMRRRGARKARPVNPQSQRLWDVVQSFAAVSASAPEVGPALAVERLEPSYSANLAPLVTRARTLQRRLNSLTPPLLLKETSVGNALAALAGTLGLGEDVRGTYRSFEIGRAVRDDVVARLLTRGWLEDPDDDDLLDQLGGTVEAFHAFIAAFVGALHVAGMTAPRPEPHVEDAGWVHLPARGLAWRSSLES